MALSARQLPDPPCFEALQVNQCQHFAGFALIVYLSTHGFDRAVLLIPTWFLLVVWVIAAGMTVAGSVTNDIVGPALLGGLAGLFVISVVSAIVGYVLASVIWDNWIRLRWRRKIRRARDQRHEASTSDTAAG